MQQKGVTCRLPNEEKQSIITSTGDSFANDQLDHGDRRPCHSNPNR